MSVKNVPSFNSPNMDTVKKIQDDLAIKITKLQAIGLPGIKDVPVSVWSTIKGQFLLSPRQIIKKKLMNQGNKIQGGTNTSFIKPIEEKDAQLIVYGKIYYQNDKLYDQDYNDSSWVWYKDNSYDDSNITCISQPGDEDFYPPIDDSNPLWQYAVELVKGLERDLLQIGIRLAEFILSIPALIATIVVSLVALVSSLIILPFGAGIPPAITAVKTMISGIKEFQAKIAVFLPYMDILERLGMIISKSGQIVITQLQAVFAILAGIIGAIIGILSLLDSVTKALTAAQAIMDTQSKTITSEPVANDTNLEPGDSTKLDAGPSGGGWNYNYQWIDDTGNIISTEKSPTVSPKKTTNYTIKLTDNTTGESKNSTVKVKVNPTHDTLLAQLASALGITITTTTTTRSILVGGGIGPGASDITTTTTTTTTGSTTTTTTTIPAFTTTTTTTTSGPTTTTTTNIPTTTTTTISGFTTTTTTISGFTTTTTTISGFTTTTTTIIKTLFIHIPNL